MNTEELKITCLELALKHIGNGEGSVLTTAKDFFDWLNDTNLSKVQEQQSEE